MSKTKQSVLVPKLRFGEFEGEWEQSKLSALITSIDSGWSPQCESYPATNDQWSILKTTSVVWDGFNENQNKALPAKFDPRPSLEVKKNDILITRAGPTERVGVVVHVAKTQGKKMLSDKIIRLRVSQTVDPRYLSWVLKSTKTQNYLSALKSGLAKAQTNISQNDLKKAKLILPTLPEQEKIAAFLTSMDDRIEQLKRKKSLLQDYQKGVMSRLFASNDECGMLNDEFQHDEAIPHSPLKTHHSLRFRQENGDPYPDWEEKKLGEVYSYIMTNSFSRDKLTYKKGDILNIHYGDIHTKFKSHFIPSKEKVPYLKETIDSNKIREECFILPQDIVLADASEDYADIGKSIEVIDTEGTKIVAGLHTYILRPQADTMATGFGTYLMQSEAVRLQIKKVAQGTKVLGLPKGYLASVILQIPHPDEQTKIANYLSNLDTKINQVTQQITQTQTFKKGLLQQMFV